MSILDDIHAAINEAFLEDKESFFRPAEIVHSVTTGGAYSPGTTTTTTQACRAFVSDYSAYLRGALGIPGNQMRVLVLQRNDAGEWVRLEVGDTIRARGEDWRVLDLSEDPVRATFEARCIPNG